MRLRVREREPTCPCKGVLMRRCEHTFELLFLPFGLDKKAMLFCIA